MKEKERWDDTNIRTSSFCLNFLKRPFYRIMAEQNLQEYFPCCLYLKSIHGLWSQRS